MNKKKNLKKIFIISVVFILLLSAIPISTIRAEFSGISGSWFETHAGELGIEENKEFIEYMRILLLNHFDINDADSEGNMRNKINIGDLNIASIDKYSNDLYEINGR